MRSILVNIAHQWQEKIWFKLASTYILLLILLILLLDWLPLAFSPNELDLSHLNLSPFSKQASSSNHFLGTDALGRDVLANTLYGARTGIAIAIPVMLASCTIGTLIGAFAGYFGNGKIKISKGTFVITILSGASFYFYGLHVPLKANTLDLHVSYSIYSILALVVSLLLLLFVLRPLLIRFQIFKSSFLFPLDKFVLRIIEIITSIPKLILVLAVASFVPPSVGLLATIIVLTYWTGTARLARAEMLRIRQLPYIEAAQSLGLTPTRIIFKEAFPNLIGPVVVAFTFGVAGILSVESTLSFLGIGLPATTPSWGRLIAGIRSDTSAWWLVVFPGTFLTLTVLSFQICSHYLLSSMRGR